MIDIKSIIIATQLFVETLPLSSSTHVWIAQRLFERLSHTKISPQLLVTEELMDVLFIPTLIVIIIFFRRELTRLISMNLHAIKNITIHETCWKLLVNTKLKLIGYAFVSTLATCNVYFFLKYVGAQINVYNQNMWIALFLGQCITALELLSLYFVPVARIYEGSLTFWKATLIGASQGLSVLPGISRLGTTLAVSRWVGLEPRRALAYSIILQAIIFIANITKNIIASPATYVSIFTHLTITHYLVALIAAGASYGGLVLISMLNFSKQLWMLSPYFLISLSILYWLR